MSSSSMETITSSSMNACMKDYWYIWTFTAVGMVLMTAIDTVIAYFFLKKFFKTDKISPKATPYATPSKAGPAWQSSSDGNSSRGSPAISQHSFNPLTGGNRNSRASPFNMPS